MVSKPGGVCIAVNPSKNLGGDSFPSRRGGYTHLLTLTLDRLTSEAYRRCVRSTFGILV